MREKLSILSITWIKSDIGYAKDQRMTLKALGFHKLNGNVRHEDTPSGRGMIMKVRHLVEVEEIVK